MTRGCDFAIVKKRMPARKKFFFKEKLVLFFLFFLFVPLDLGLAFLAWRSFSWFTPQKVETKKEVAFLPSLYASLPSLNSEVSFQIISSEARPEIIRQYLLRYHSPLAPYADYIFAVSQKYGLDYRLLVAIAQQESNLGKKIPANSYNAWGWGIHSRGTLKFSSWEEAIETVARGLRENYLDRGLTTPEEIMKVYTPLSNGSWAAGVRQFMEEME